MIFFKSVKKCFNFILVGIEYYFYFLIIRPQGKRAKTHEKFLTELKRGDEVLTASGILGKIDGLTDQFVTLEIANGVKVKMLRKQVTSSTANLIEAKKT